MYILLQIDISFHFQEKIEEKAAPIWKKKKNLPKVTKSFNDMMVRDMLGDFVSSTINVRMKYTENMCCFICYTKFSKEYFSLSDVFEDLEVNLF